MPLDYAMNSIPLIPYNMRGTLLLVVFSILVYAGEFDAILKELPRKCERFYKFMFQLSQFQDTTNIPCQDVSLGIKATRSPIANDRL